MLFSLQYLGMHSGVLYIGVYTAGVLVGQDTCRGLFLEVVLFLDLYKKCETCMEYIPSLRACKMFLLRCLSNFIGY